MVHDFVDWPCTCNDANNANISTQLLFRGFHLSRGCTGIFRNRQQLLVATDERNIHDDCRISLTRYSGSLCRVFQLRRKHERYRHWNYSEQKIARVSATLIAQILKIFVKKV